MPGDPDEPERGELEAARRALYRPGAGAEHRRAFEALTALPLPAALPAATEAEAGGAPGAGPRARRPRVLGVALLVVAAALVAFVVAPALHGLLPGAQVAVTMEPLLMTGATDADSQEAAVLSLFADSFSAQNQLSLRAVVDRPPSMQHGGVQRATVHRFSGSGRIAVQAPAGARSATVLVLCTTVSTYRWTLVGQVRPGAGSRTGLAGSSASRCSGTAAYATVPLAGAIPASLSFTSPEGGRTLVAVVVSG